MWKILKHAKAKIFEDRNFKESLTYLFVYLMNKITYTELFRMMVLEETAARRFRQTQDDGFSFVEGRPFDLKSYTYNIKRLGDGFLYESQTRGDTFFAGIEDKTNTVVSYGWYTKKSIVINPHVELSFPTDYVYMFNGFTEPAYRGYRLHGRGMALYAIKLIESGKKGLVSYVNAENYRSLHSCDRLGYRIVGTIMAIKIFKKTFVFSFGGCTSQGISMKSVSAHRKSPIFEKVKH